MDNSTRRMINSLAEDVLSAYNISVPIGNIDEIVEKLGGTIQKEAFFSDGAVEKEGNGFKIIVSPFQDEKRERFTIAHELGHLFLHMGYRTSVIKEAGYIVLEAVISLEKGDQEEIRSRMQELAGMRTSKQPLSYPSAGSTFKRPEGYFAGKLIMDSGLRGYQVGGAQVSEKHCGFVINTGNATAKDVTTLMSDVQRIVMEKFGVKLEPEVKFLGEFQSHEESFGMDLRHIRGRRVRFTATGQAVSSDTVLPGRR